MENVVHPSEMELRIVSLYFLGQLPAGNDLVKHVLMHTSECDECKKRLNEIDKENEEVYKEEPEIA